MKKFTQTTLIALVISCAVFSQTKDEPVKNPTGGTIVNQSSNSRLILLSPADGKSFNGSEGSKPVLFRWTAIVPKPKEAVTYRLKVWQLMQGQNGTDAMRSNQPIVTKDLTNITQAAISNLYTGPCKPPYLCDFIWAVEVLNSEGNQLYTNSHSYSFKYTGGIGTVTGSGGATVDIKSPDKELENTKTVKEEYGNKGNAGNSGMSGGKSLNAQGDPVDGVDVKLGASEKRNIKNPENVKRLNANGDSGYKYKTYQPGKPIYGNIYQSGDVESETYVFEYGVKWPKDESTGLASGKSMDKEVDKGTPPSAKSLHRCIHCDHRNSVFNMHKKSLDKEVDKGQPTYDIDLPVEKIIYDADGNIVVIATTAKAGKISVLIDEVRIIELATAQIKSLKISNEEYLKALYKYIATGETNSQIGWPIECWQVPCDGSCNMGPNCPGKVWRCKWVGFAK